MARPLRIEYEGAFYHITARGNEKRTIFRSEQDLTRFLSLLQRVHERYGILVHAYVLMTNHYHLILETPKANLISTLHDLNTAYTNYFNRRYNRTGHLFQGRYRSLLVEKDTYLLELSRYIHLNPLRAGVVKRPEDYQWSSYPTYLSTRPQAEWLCTSEILGQLSRQKEKARHRYRQFVEEGLKTDVPNPLKGAIAGIAVGGSTFWESLKERFRGVEKDREIPSLRQTRRRTDIETIARKVAEYYGVPTELIYHKKRPSHSASQVALYLARKMTDLGLSEIGAVFGGRHYTAVSIAYRRVEQRRQRDSKFHHEIEQIEKELKQV